MGRQRAAERDVLCRGAVGGEGGGAARGARAAPVRPPPSQSCHALRDPCFLHVFLKKWSPRTGFVHECFAATSSLSSSGGLERGRGNLSSSELFCGVARHLDRFGEKGS